MAQLCRFYGYTPDQVRALTLADGRMLIEYLAYEQQEAQQRGDS